MKTVIGILLLIGGIYFAAYNFHAVHIQDAWYNHAGGLVGVLCACGGFFLALWDIVGRAIK